MTVEAPTLDSKTPNESISVEFDFEPLLVSPWRPGERISVGNFRRPTRTIGKELEATAAGSNPGQTGYVEPVWPRTAGQTIVDGNVTWTVREYGTSAVDTINSQSGEVEAGLTMGTVTRSGFIVFVPVSGGEHGKVYAVTAQIVTAGGKTLEQTSFLPVSYQQRC